MACPKLRKQILDENTEAGHDDEKIKDPVGGAERTEALHPQFQTLMFVYLMYSAQATIYLTRVRRRFWSFAPSPYVAAATIGNVMVASTLAVWGVMMAPVPALLLAGMLGAVLAAAVLLDQVKSWIFQTMEMTGDRVNRPKLRA